MYKVSRICNTYMINLINVYIILSRLIKAYNLLQRKFAILGVNAYFLKLLVILRVSVQCYGGKGKGSVTRLYKYVKTLSILPTGVHRIRVSSFAYSDI
jgi:hypothetical protein